MDYVNITILVIQIVGFSLGGVVVYRLLQQIGALKGTVQAQAETVAAGVEQDGAGDGEGLRPEEVR